MSPGPLACKCIRGCMTGFDLIFAWHRLSRGRCGRGRKSPTRRLRSEWATGLQPLGLTCPRHAIKGTKHTFCSSASPLSPPSACRAAAQREVTVWFNGDVAEDMPWEFKPTQQCVRVRPGQSTLVFFTAKNKR